MWTSILRRRSRIEQWGPFLRFSALLALMLVSGTCRVADEPFPVLYGIGRAVVVNQGHDSLRAITDSVELARIVEFVNARSDGWDVPFFGHPVPEVIIEFHAPSFLAGPSSRGSFGAGGSFFSTQRVGRFGTRWATREEIAEFWHLTGVTPEMVNRSRYITPLGAPVTPTEALLTGRLLIDSTLVLLGSTPLETARRRLSTPPAPTSTHSGSDSIAVCYARREPNDANTVVIELSSVAGHQERVSGYRVFAAVHPPASCVPLPSHARLEMAALRRIRLGMPRKQVLTLLPNAAPTAGSPDVMGYEVLGREPQRDSSHARQGSRGAELTFAGDTLIDIRAWRVRPR